MATDQRLGDLIEDFLKCHYILNTQQRSVCNWYRFIHCVTHAELRQELGASLTVAQAHAYRVLLEWWMADCVDEDSRIRWKRHVLEDTQFKRLVTSSGFTRNSVILSALPDPMWNPGQEGYEKPRHCARYYTHYNQEMRELFYSEFGTHRDTSSQYGDDPSVDGVRRSAVKAAFCQRSARASIRYYTNDRFVSDYGDHEPEWSLLRNTAEMLDLRLGPTLQACSWITHQKPGMPYYVWDVAKGQTVETSTLSGIDVQYTAISHTWGRWRLADKPRKFIPGSLWEIPQNSRFLIDELPSILRQIPCQTPYVWFDLVCIPQNRSPIAKAEIARQALIFRKAKCSIAWLNDLESFEVLEATARWMALQLLDCKEASDDEDFEIPEPEEDLDFQRELRSCTNRALSDAGHGRTGLFEPWTEDIFTERPKLQPWYSSLWTLQEACLRPDMWICTKDWKLLSLDGGRTPLTLDGFWTINSVFHVDGISRMDEEGYGDLPDAIEMELELAEQLTNMGGIASLTRNSILSMGDTRYCATHRSAMAIMSAVDATDWYLDCEGEAPEGSIMLLNRYPLSFVEEVRQRLGAWFFTSGAWIYNEERFSDAGLGEPSTYFAKHRIEQLRDVILSGHLHPDKKLELAIQDSRQSLVESISDIKLSVPPKATLLPFGAGEFHQFWEIRNQTGRPAELHDHPSTQSWTFISHDQVSSGAMQFPEVAIVCTTDSLASSQLVFIRQGERITPAEMQAQMRATSRRKLVAVLTVYGGSPVPSHFQGIVLEQLVDGVEAYVKTDLFTAVVSGLHSSDAADRSQESVMPVTTKLSQPFVVL